MQTIMEKGSESNFERPCYGNSNGNQKSNRQDISVNAKKGVATLTGFVHSYAEKIAAEKAAKSVYGV
jgi:osmotically-inducible protein OsmY